MEPVKIFTIGSATFDIFVKPTDQAILAMTRPQTSEKWLCLKYGGKVKIDTVTETFGGGAANTAIAFSRLGLEAYFVGKVGADYGDRVIENLEHDKVHTYYARKTKDDKTGFSTIINTLDGDRTVLGYAGANRLFTAKDLPLDRLAEADWIFLNHISGDSAGILAAVTRLMDRHPRIGLAWNPGYEQLSAGLKRWEKLLRHTDLLFVNKEEAALFSGRHFHPAAIRQEVPGCHVHTRHSFLPPYADDVTEIMMEFFKYGVKTAIVTDGRNGSQASDGKRLYFCPVITTKRVDTLGAGDAFASGFTAAVIADKDLKTALKSGTINANSVVSQYGAQAGLLPKDTLAKRLAETELCVSSTKLIL